MIYSSPVVHSLPQSAQMLSTALLNNHIYSPNKPDIAELLNPSRRIQIPACVSEPIASFQQYLGVNFHPKSEQILKILSEYTHSRNVKSSEEAMYNGVALCFMEQVYLTETSESFRSLFTSSEEWAHSEFYGFLAYVKSFVKKEKGLGFYEAILKDYKLYAKGLAAFREIMCRILAELDIDKKRNPSELFNWLNEYDFLTQEIFSKLAHLLHCKIRILIVSPLGFMEETFFFTTATQSALENRILSEQGVREYTVLYDITSDKSYLLYVEDEKKNVDLETILEAPHETVETPTHILENKNFWITLQALNWLRAAPQQQMHQHNLVYHHVDKENLSPAVNIEEKTQQQLHNSRVDINSGQIILFQGLMEKYRKVKDQIEEISGDLKKFEMSSGSLEARDMNASNDSNSRSSLLNPVLSSLLQGFVYQNELLKVQLDQLNHTIQELREKGTAKSVLEIHGLKPSVEHERVRSRQNSIMESFINKNELVKMQIGELSSVLTKLEEQKLSSNFDSQQGGLMSSPGNTIKAKLQELSSLEGNYGDFSEQKSDFAGNPSIITEAQILLSQKTESEVLLEGDQVNSSTFEGRRPRISVEAERPSFLNYDAVVSAPIQPTEFSTQVGQQHFATVGSVASASGTLTSILEKEIIVEQEEYSKGDQLLLNSRNSHEGLEPKRTQQTPKHGSVEDLQQQQQLQESPEKKTNDVLLEKAENWLGLYKTPEKGFYMQTEVQTPNRQFYSRGLMAELEMSRKRSSCRSTSPKKGSNQIREALAVRDF